MKEGSDAVDAPEVEEKEDGVKGEPAKEPIDRYVIGARKDSLVADSSLTTGNGYSS